MGDLVTKQEMEVSTEVLPQKQVEYYGKLLRIIDRNPKVVWKRGDDDHNQDFIMIRGGYEPTRSFTLKAQKVANYSLYAHEPNIVELKDDVAASVQVKVWDNDGEVTAIGACSKSEIMSKRGSNTRWFHDMTTTAETRGFKRALEAKAGLPFINLIIKELFGGFGMKGDEADVTASVVDDEPQSKPKSGPITAEVKELADSMYWKLKRAASDGVITGERGKTWWNKVMASLHSTKLLKVHNENIDLEIEKASNAQG